VVNFDVARKEPVTVSSSTGCLLNPEEKGSGGYLSVKKLTINQDPVLSTVLL